MNRHRHGNGLGTAPLHIPRLPLQLNVEFSCSHSQINRAGSGSRGIVEAPVFVDHLNKRIDASKIDFLAFLELHRLVYLLKDWRNAHPKIAK